MLVLAVVSFQNNLPRTGWAAVYDHPLEGSGNGTNGKHGLFSTHNDGERLEENKNCKKKDIEIRGVILSCWSKIVLLSSTRSTRPDVIRCDLSPST